MTENKPVIYSDLAKVDAHRLQPEEYEEIPELTDEWFAKADLHVDALITTQTRGRPSGSMPPRSSCPLRLDQDVIDRFRADGPGWQSRINAALRQYLRGK